MFGNLRAVVDGQLPAGEINQLGACVFMCLMEGGGFDVGYKGLLWGENEGSFPNYPEYLRWGIGALLNNSQLSRDGFLNESRS